MEHATIPGPPGLPLLGNLSDIDAENPIQSLCTLTTKYGQWSSSRLLAGVSLFR